LATIAVFLLPPVPQSLSYHRFCDRRPFLGVPSFANVISNLPFLFIGLRGYLLLPKTARDSSLKIIGFFTFTGILLTAFGSAWYHLHPGNDTLLFDRLPMTIVFMSLLAAVIAVSIGRRVGLAVLGPLLLTGIASVCWWRHTELLGRGDLRLYILVQYYPPLLITAILLLYPSQTNRQGLRPLILATVWYATAKILDILDCPIYTAGTVVSGHTLKHIAAAISAWYLVNLFKSYSTAIKNGCASTVL